MNIGLLYKGDEEKEIWGCAIVTLYLKNALEKMGHKVWRASVDVTKNWSQFFDPLPDLIISASAPHYEMPTEFFNHRTKLVYWWLSRLFYDNVKEICSSGFHGVGTNSWIFTEELKKENKPSGFIALAAPPELAEAKMDKKYATPCIFLGSPANKTYEQVKMLITAASDHGIALWGYGWEELPFTDYWKGPLPLNDIGPLYKSAKCALAFTEARQTEHRMINNRIFEGLITGTIMLSEPNPTLSSCDLADYVNCVSTEEEARNFLSNLFSDESIMLEVKEKALAGQKVVLAKHTYTHRANDFLKLYEEIV